MMRVGDCAASCAFQFLCLSHRLVSCSSKLFCLDSSLPRLGTAHGQGGMGIPVHTPLLPPAGACLLSPSWGFPVGTRGKTNCQNGMHCLISWRVHKTKRHAEGTGVISFITIFGDLRAHPKGSTSSYYKANLNLCSISPSPAMPLVWQWHWIEVGWSVAGGLSRRR